MDETYNFNSTIDSTQQIDPAMAGLGLAIFGGVLFLIILIALAYYIYMSICLMKIARKANEEPAWLAWIPIANLFLMIIIAKKPIWLIILYFIPLVNVVVSIIVWMGISKSVGKPDWLGILMIVPIANIIIPGYLAFSKMENKVSPVDQAPLAPPVA